MNMKLKPLHDNVIVKPLSEEKTTKSGIVLPETVSGEKPEKGEVLAVGPGKRTESGNLLPIGVKVGDKVIFKKYSPDEIKLDKQEYLLLSESDILAILK
jgi:chaperonin GroES